MTDIITSAKPDDDKQLSTTAVDRISYGMGGAVYAVKEAAYMMFVLLFYTQVLGLSGTATGIVLFLAILWDAVSDPMVGTWSDRFKSRWGRRHPFMVASVLPLALGFVALFWPPDIVKENMDFLAVWLLFWSLWVRTARPYSPFRISRSQPKLRRITMNAADCWACGQPSCFWSGYSCPLSV